MDKNTETMQHNFNKLYKGKQSETFNEVEYLQDVASLRHEVLELAKKYNLLEENKQVKDKSLLNDKEYCFPDGNERIAKNGGFALGSFDAFTGIPKKIYTPYGAVKILDNNMTSSVIIKKRPEGFFQKRKYEANIKKFKQSLNKMLGLVDMQFDAKMHSGKFDTNKWSKAVSKLPWKAVDLPSEIYHADETVSNAYGKDERVYLRSVFDVANAGLCLMGHPERIIPGTDNVYSINGLPKSLSAMAKEDPEKTYHKAMDHLREIRNPLNAEMFGLSPVQAMEASFEPQREVAPATTQQVLNADLGREL